MSCEVAIKVDVDTQRGYLEGVPCLLDILGKRGIKASFFFSMGPDNSGKAIRHIFNRGFLSKILRTKAPMIVASNPDVLKRAVDEGHDCAIHCWDHALWQDCLRRMTREEIRAELSKAMELFVQTTGTAPKSCAAPGWQASFDSLTVQDELGFDYCSDVRGARPFLPRMEGVLFRTLQIPTTLPTLDELQGGSQRNTESINDMYLDLLESGLNIHTVHAEIEGILMGDMLKGFLDCCIEGEVAFPTLKEVAARFKGTTEAGISDVEMEIIPGRIEKVALQKE